MEAEKKSSCRRWLLAVVAFLVVAAAIIAGAVVLSQRPHYDVAPAALPRPDEPVMVEASPPATPVDLTEVKKAAKDRQLGRLSAEITDLETGEVIYANNEGKHLVPASSTKVYTTAAALLTKGPQDRLATSVVKGGPGELILVGEGDITLSRKPGSGFFTDAPAISELADQVRRALPPEELKKITKITVDNSMREKSTFHKSWDLVEIGMGNVTFLDSVMIDAGRIIPTENYSARSNTPARDVAQALAEDMGLGEKLKNKKLKLEVSDDPVGPAHPTAEEALGQVLSAPLSTRLRDMMLHSDNMLAEAVGREVAISQDLPGTFKGATEGVLKVLKDNGVDTEGAVLHDTSGMSEDNRLSAHNLNSALGSKKLHALQQDLPVAGAEGALRNRYLAGSGAEDAAGWVRAKTGFLDGVNALAGTVVTKSGRPLSFAFLSNTPADVGDGREALDRLAAAVYRL